MNKPILDPPLPYVDFIQGGNFKPQSLVRIQGTTLGLASRFNINLQCGPTTSPQDDIAIQISVRMLDGFIIINSLQNGIWGEEQVHSKVPINCSERFEIIILCDESLYKVAINGLHYCEFPQRIRNDRISHLAIDGNVSIIKISYETTSQGSISSTSYPKPIAPLAHEIDDFSRPQSGYQSQHSGFQPLPPVIHPVSSVGFNDPPPYEEAVHGKQFQHFPGSGAPYPNSGAPYPNYPGHPTPGSGYNPQPGSYPPPGMQATYPLHQAAPPIPLNVAGSTFRPVKSNHTKKRCCIGVFAGVIFIIILVSIVTTRIEFSNAQSSMHNDYWT